MGNRTRARHKCIGKTEKGDTDGPSRLQKTGDWSELVYVWLLTANLQQEEALERINGKSKQIQVKTAEARID